MVLISSVLFNNVEKSHKKGKTYTWVGVSRLLTHTACLNKKEADTTIHIKWE